MHEVGAVVLDAGASAKFDDDAISKSREPEKGEQDAVLVVLRTHGERGGEPAEKVRGVAQRSPLGGVEPLVERLRVRSDAIALAEDLPGAETNASVDEGGGDGLAVRLGADGLTRRGLGDGEGADADVVHDEVARVGVAGDAQTRGGAASLLGSIAASDARG